MRPDRRIFSLTSYTSSPQNRPAFDAFCWIVLSRKGCSRNSFQHGTLSVQLSFVSRIAGRDPSRTAGRGAPSMSTAKPASKHPEKKAERQQTPLVVPDTHPLSRRLAILIGAIVGIVP